MKVKEYETSKTHLKRVNYNGIEYPTFITYEFTYDRNPNGLIIVDNDDVQFITYNEILQKVQSQLESDDQSSFEFSLYPSRGKNEYREYYPNQNNQERKKCDCYEVEIQYSNKTLSVLLYQTESKDDTIKLFVDVDSDINLTGANSLAQTYIEALINNDESTIDEITTDNYYSDPIMKEAFNNALLSDYVFMNPRSTNQTDGYDSYANIVRVMISKTQNENNIKMNYKYELEFNYKIIGSKMLITSVNGKIIHHEVVK